MDPRISLTRNDPTPAFDKAKAITESKKLRPEEQVSPSTYRVNELRADQDLQGIFAMRSFLGFDLLENYFDGTQYYNQLFEPSSSHFEGTTYYNQIELPAFIRVLKHLFFDPAYMNRVEQKNMPEFQAHFMPIIQRHYLSKHIDKDKMMHMLKALYKQIEKFIEEEQRSSRRRESTEYNQALESFIDSLIEEKIIVSKAPWKYKHSVEDVMGDFYDRLFNIYEVMAIEPVFEKHNCELIYPKHYKSTWVCSNPIDLIIYEHLLNDNFPLGFIKFMLLPEKVSGTMLVLSLSFYKGKKIIQRYRLTFDLERQFLSIKDSHNQRDSLRFKLSRFGVSKIKGELNNKAVSSTVEKRGDRFEEQLTIDPWISGRVTNHQQTEEGSFSNSTTKKVKQLESHYQVSRSKERSFVYKTVTIGEDKYACTYVFRGQIPIPVSAAGFIKNKEAPSEKWRPFDKE